MDLLMERGFGQDRAAGRFRRIVALVRHGNDLVSES